MGFLPVLIQRNFNAAGLGGVATNVGLGAEGWAEGLKKRPGTVISLKGEAAMPGLASRL